jgi:hypothetical protein
MWTLPKLRVTTNRLTSAALLLVTVTMYAAKWASAQNTPLISGGAEFLSNTRGGNTSYIATVQPLIAAPLGPHLLVEGRAAFLQDFYPKGGGQTGYGRLHFSALTYLQLNYLAGPHLTVVAGEFLTPFGTYNERQTPVWMSNFQDAPLIFNLGVGTGSNVGGMVRGSAVSTPKFSIDYAAYYSAASSNPSFHSRHAYGGRASVYLPEQRLEIGTSYVRSTNKTAANDIGAHLWWEPEEIPLKLRSEYAHGAHAQGYWVETDYRFTRFVSTDTLIGRVEPVVRWQQTFRNRPDSTDGLPSADTQRVDGGLDFHLPHEVRINTSYSRQLSSTGNTNIWETGIVYRFLFPAWRGK